jgi:hypothetical protein
LSSIFRLQSFFASLAISIFGMKQTVVQTLNRASKVVWVFHAQGRSLEARQMTKKKWYPCVEPMMIATLWLGLSACTSQTVKMIEPQTGATAECSGSSVGFGQLFTESFVDSCARVYQNRGYVPLERLTPDERASLERRGLLPKD